MKKFYAFAAACAAVLSMNAQVYFCGNGTNLGWAPEAPLEVTAKDGKYTMSFESLTALKISTSKGSAEGDWAGFNAGGYYAEFAKSTDKTQSTALESNADPGNINMPWVADWTVEIPVDMSTITITTTTPAPTGPAEVYLRGDMTGENWAANPDYKFTYADGKYTLSCTLPAGQAFKIADGNWGTINYGYGIIESNQLGEPLEFNYSGNNTSMDADFTGTISFDALEKWGNDTVIVVTFTAGAVDGIAEIEAAEQGAAEYFNLQGVRVAEPAAGLYLVRRAGKVEKVLVK